MKLISVSVFLLSCAVGFVSPEATLSRPFVYKCDPTVPLDFWSVPDQFRVFFEETNGSQFREQQYNEFFFNFTLKPWRQSCESTFAVNVSAETNDIPWEDVGKTHFNFTPDGHVAYVKGDEEIYFDRENYCIEKLNDELLRLRFCKSKCSHNEEEVGPGICIPKCCPLGLLMKYSNDEPSMCVESPVDWTPKIYQSLASSKRFQTYPQYHYVDPTSITCMNDSVEFRVHAISELKILPDGRIFTRRPNQTSVLAWEPVFTGHERFCVDGFWQGNEYNPDTSNLFVTTCAITQESTIKDTELDERLEKHLWHSKIVWFLVYIPCVIIHLAVVVIYGILWDKHSAHGWTAMALSASQLLLYAVLLTLVGIVLFDKIELLVKGPLRPLCATLGILHHFADLSCYSWTAVLTFDIWRRFRPLELWSQPSSRLNGFLMYCCFGVGVPAAIVTIACIMEWLMSDYEGYKIEPGYSNYCTVFGQEAYLAYMGIPNAALFTANLILAFCAFTNAWKMKNLRTSSSTTFSRFDRLAFMGKLMFLTGIFLIFEFIFNFVGLIDISVYFTILESYRVLHAIGFFWILVCNRRIFELLGSKFSCLGKFSKDKPSAYVTEGVFYRKETH